MTTKHDTQNCSVVLAFAELDRLEHDRSELASAKRVATLALDQQASDLRDLRARLLAQRTRAFAQAEGEQAQRRNVRGLALSEMTAQAEALHRERLACYQASLEAKRLRLAAIEAMPIVERPGRRILEWSVPAAAIALVAFLGFTFIGEEDAVARAAAPVDTHALSDEQDSPAEAEVEVEVVIESEVFEVEPEPEPEPEAKPEPKPVKTNKPKPVKTNKPKPVKTDEPKPTKTPHTNPLKIGDFNGNPLG